MVSYRVERVVTPSGRIGWTLGRRDGSVVEPVDAWLRFRFHTEASPNTLKAYAHDLKHFFTFLDEEKLEWRSIQPVDLGSFTGWLRRPATNVVLLPGAEPARVRSSVNRALSAVFGFYDFHRTNGVELGEHLTTHLLQSRGSFKPFLHGIAAAKGPGRPGRLAASRRRPRVLEPTQLAEIIAAQPRLRNRLLFALLGLAGLRIGQALGLRHEDIRPWAHELELVPREDNANGARGKRSSGIVPLAQEVLDLYLLYMEHEYGLLDSDYVFVNLWGGEIGAPMTYSSVDKLVARTVRRVGFDFDFDCHDLRHTFVTQLRRHRVPLEVVSRLVTHRSITTAADTYSHLDVEDLRRELEAAGWHAGGHAA